MSMEIKFAEVSKEIWKAMQSGNKIKFDCLSIELSEPGRSVMVGRAVDGSGNRCFRFKRPLPTDKTSVLEFSLSSEAVQALIVLLVEHGRKDELASCHACCAADMNATGERPETRSERDA